MKQPYIDSWKGAADVLRFHCTGLVEGWHACIQFEPFSYIWESSLHKDTCVPIDFTLVKFVCDKNEAISAMEMV